MKLTAKEAIYKIPQNASDALNQFSNIVNTQLVNADAALNRFWAETSLGGTAQLRLISSPPSTPVIDLFRIQGYVENIRIHFMGKSIMENDSQVFMLTVEEFKAIAMPSFLKMFNLPCPFVTPFTSLMTSRMVVYCEVYPDLDLLNPIIEAASSEGDNGFYFSFVEDYDYEIWYPGLSRKSSYLKTWFIPFGRIRFYQEQTFLTSHVMYSPQGKWGAYVSYKDFMVLGGIPEVINRIKQGISDPDPDALVHKFIEERKSRFFSLGETLEWVPKLLDHIYCPEEKNRLLQEHGLKYIDKGG